MLDTIAANAPLSVAASKLAVTAIADGVSPTGTALAALEEARRRVWASEDAKEGPRAFRERRPPNVPGLVGAGYISARPPRRARCESG